MSSRNLHVRQSTSTTEYLNRYISCIQPFTPNEKKHLTSVIRQATQLLDVFPRRRLSRNIPWRLAKLACHLENGYPHTLGDVIIVSGDNASSITADTLIHEKIHVFQRLYPQETQELICGVYGYKKTRIEIPEDARNNPDVDGYLYLKKTLGHTRPRSIASYMALRQDAVTIDDCYIKHVVLDDTIPASSSPSSVTDTETYEHPFERMAYELTDTITSQKCYTTPAYGWMLRNL